MSRYIVVEFDDHNGAIEFGRMLGELVRCGECKHWNEEDHWCNIRDSYGWDYKADDFCSYGERSEKPNNSKERSE